MLTARDAQGVLWPKPRPPSTLTAGTARFGARHGALECCRAPVIVDRGPEALELVGRRMVQPGRNEQTVERELEVGATGRCVADGDSEVFLQRRAGVEPDVVCTAEKKRGLPERSSGAASSRAGPSRYSS